MKYRGGIEMDEQLEKEFEKLLKIIHAMRSPVESALQRARKIGWDAGYEVGKREEIEISEKFVTGLVGETEDMTCHIHQSGFPKITVYARLDEFGNQLQPDDDLQKEANWIAGLLNGE